LTGSVFASKESRIARLFLFQDFVLPPWRTIGQPPSVAWGVVYGRDRLLKRACAAFYKAVPDTFLAVEGNHGCAWQAV
jgi:hypothetical protein